MKLNLTKVLLIFSVSVAVAWAALTLQRSLNHQPAGLVQAQAMAVTALQGQPASPCDQPPYRQFDFWLGDWEVYYKGQLAGTNRIERILDGCVLLENWTGTRGGSGKSINFYHAGTGQWQQTWVSSTGGVLELKGEFKDDVMRLAGPSLTCTGQQVLNRLTFTKLSPDRVRQYWEQSSDNGQTWTELFDGDYRRKQ